MNKDEQGCLSCVTCGQPWPTQWQGLTDDEVNDIKTKAIIGSKGMSVDQLLWFIVSLAEQALKDKNT